MKKLLSLVLALALCFSLTVPAFAANKAGDTTITDANGTYTLSMMGLEETVPEGTALRGTIENYSFLGRMIRYWVRVGEEVFVIDDANVDLTGARTGDVQLRLDTRKLHVLKGGGADAAG